MQQPAHGATFPGGVGPAGSGKSSLVQAGLIPALRNGAVLGNDSWETLVTRPANNPFAQLANQGLPGGAEDLTAAADAWLASHRDLTRLVVIVDQFEELLEASEQQPLVFAVSLHGFILGQPFRLRPLRQAIKHCVQQKHADQIWFTRAGDIARYCMDMEPGMIPGS